MPCKPNVMKSRVAQGERLIGLWCSLTSTTAVEALSTLGYDWLLLDMEHSPNELPGVIDQLRVLDSAEVTGVVRPPSADPTLIKRLLDAGVTSFLFPWVQSAEQARDIVRATRYPPHGVRGVSLATRAAWYGQRPDYLREAADGLVVAVQIESQAALAELPAIAATPGVDIVFFGPADLSADMGLLGQPEHPEVRAAIAQGIATVREQGKMAGVLAPNLTVAGDYLQAGARFVAVGSDIACMMNGARTLLASARAL